jgi:hypothetical protein
VKDPIVIEPSRMTFSIFKARRDIARVTLFGHFEVGMIGVFGRELSILLRLHPAYVQMDMSRPRRIEGPGVELLLSFFENLCAQGGRIALCGLHDQPLEAFKGMLLAATGLETMTVN